MMSNNQQLGCVASTTTTTITTTTTTTTTDCLPQQRRIDFHLARKPSSSLPFISPNFKLETLNPSSSSPSTATFSQTSSKKSESSEVFDGALDMDLAFRIPFRRIGAGLENLGNTCFLNSVIQCLTYTEPLVAYLQTAKHQTTCRVAGFCALCAIQKHVNRALQSTGRILAPKDLVSNLRCISRNFRNARQEDAHEYMIHLLESMHKCCLPSGVPAESPGAYEKSLVHKIFGGRLRSQVKCLQCSHCSNTFDPFLDLSLEIIKADSVYKALMNFTAAEQLDGGERQYKCERCKQKVRALKQLTVYKAPYVLTVHLKRFRHFAGQKIDKKVHFGSSLNLKPFVSGAYEGDLTYTLYGVLVHAGWSTHSGHYYCFVRTSTGLWYSLDDNRVYQVSEKTVMEQKAYMLFYVRDRKNNGPKKAVDVQKENLIATMRNASSSCSVSGVKSLQNGYSDKNLKDAISPGLLVKHAESRNSSDILDQQHTSKFGVSNSVSLKKEFNQFSNCKISSVYPVLMTDNLSNTKTDMVGKVDSTTPITNDHSGKSIKVSPLAAGYDNIGEKGLVSSEKQSISDCPSSVKNSNMVGTSAGTNVHNSLSNNIIDDLAKADMPSDSATQPIIENGIGKVKDGDMEPMLPDACLVVSKLRIRKSSTNGVYPLKSRESTRRQRLLREIFKSGVGGSHLSTKMLYGASFSLRNRKRFKRLKKISKSVLQQQRVLVEELLPTDMGPSTSDTNSVNSFKHSHKKVYSSSVREENGAFSESTISKDQSCQETGSLPSRKSSKEPHSQLENGLSIAVIRGHEESVVGRWEGIESPMETGKFNIQDTLSIGHVLDEWDEEYDRGKRKKVRALHNSFGGRNVFQEVATKKAKLKVKSD